MSLTVFSYLFSTKLYLEWRTEAKKEGCWSRRRYVLEILKKVYSLQDAISLHGKFSYILISIFYFHYEFIDKWTISKESLKIWPILKSSWVINIKASNLSTIFLNELTFNEIYTGKFFFSVFFTGVCLLYQLSWI